MYVVSRSFGSERKSNDKSVLTYIDVSAASDGIDNGFAFYLVSIANAASFFGRMIGGILADKIGKAIHGLLDKYSPELTNLCKYKGAMNVMTPGTLIAGILTYIWPFVHGKSSYIAIAIVYG